MQSHSEESWSSVMANEIPRLEVITAIEDRDLEDYVAQLLFSQGWSIIYRALDATSLREILASRGGARTIVIYTSNMSGLSSDLLLFQEELNFTAISLDAIPLGERNPHNIMTIIRGYVRAPMIQQVKPMRPEAPAMKQRRVITVTGTTGAPGRTLLSIALAEEYSLTHTLSLVDADMRSRTLTRTLRGKSTPYEIASLDPSVRPSSLPEVGNRDISLVDLGTLPPLGDLVNDRRWQAVLTHNILQATSHLLFVCKPTVASMEEVREFVHEFPLLLQTTPITFICVTQSLQRSTREALSTFDSILAASRRAVIQHRLLVDSGLNIPLLSTPTRSKKEIAKIALSLI